MKYAYDGFNLWAKYDGASLQSIRTYTWDMDEPRLDDDSATAQPR